MHNKIPINIIIIIPKNGVRISESSDKQVRITEGLLYLQQFHSTQIIILYRQVNEDTVEEVTESVNAALEVTVTDMTQQTGDVLRGVAAVFDNVLEYSQNVSVTNATIPPGVRVHNPTWGKSSQSHLG